MGEAIMRWERIAAGAFAGLIFGLGAQVYAASSIPVPKPKPPRPVTVTSVYDGDSFRIRDGASSIPIRVMGLDTPELRQFGNGRPVPLCESAMADQARAYADNLLRAPGADVAIRSVSLDRYGRLLAWVFVDGKPMDKVMIEAGHGRQYDGGRREGWC